MSNEPFFEREGDVYRPTPVGASPWTQKSLHGRVVAGLLAYEIERAHGEPDLQPARLTVDLYRMPDFSPVQITTKRVRDGRRIRVVDAEFVSGGVSVARASCQLLRRSENPPEPVWDRPNWDVPSPAELEAKSETFDALEGMWKMLPITGGFGGTGERRIWMRDIRPLVDEEPLTPWQRTALAADFASPFANAHEAGLSYINSDITLYLHRLPFTEWIGFEVADHQATDGVSLASCYMYDEQGPIGSSSMAALAQAPMSMNRD